jgi:polyisoprenoid-binding protein YceI
MSEYHKGNPKTYSLKKKKQGKWVATPIKEKGSLEISKAEIHLEGADLKSGTIELSSEKFGKGVLKITNAFLGKGGVFNSKGVLELKGIKKELFFDVNLGPIKKGFEFKTQINFAQEDFKLKLYEKNKKAYDDVSFKIKMTLIEK